MSTESPKPDAPITVSAQADSNSATSELDRKLKELDVEKKRAEVDAQKDWWARWNNPVILAIVAAIVGYLSTLLTSQLNRSVEETRNKATLNLEQTKFEGTLQLERKKFEGTLILDAIKTGDGMDHDKRAAANLLFLSESNLITLDESSREKLKQIAQNTPPGLPSAPNTGASSPAKVTQIGTRIAIPTSAGEEHVTLGCLVIAEDKSREFLCLLTTNNLSGTIKEVTTITLPGRPEGFRALVVQEADLKSGKAIGMLALIQSGRVSAASSSYKLDPNPIEPAVGMQVVMEGGRSEGIRKGRISEIQEWQVIQVPSLNKHVGFKGIFFIESSDGMPFSQHGDSGAIVVEAKTRRPVGMLVGTSGKDGAAMRMREIMQELNITRIVADYGSN